MEPRRFAGVPFAENYIVSSDGMVFRQTQDHGYQQLKPWLNRGCPMVALRVGGKTIKVLVHRMVLALHGSPPPFPGAEARHKDANKSNCRVDNLEWGTHADNMADMARHLEAGVTARNNAGMRRGSNHPLKLNPGLASHGETHSSSKLAESQVLDILKRLGRGESGAKLAREYGVTHALITRIKTNKCWKHIDRKKVA